VKAVTGMTRATVFGVDVWSDQGLAVLSGSRAPATGRPLTVTVERQGMSVGEGPVGSRLLGRRLGPEGRPVFTVRADAQEGWCLAGEEFGEHSLSADGLRLLIRAQGAAPARWQRFLLAQVLPFAAAVKGLEVMHASAVVLGGGAVALLGPGGAGKTTLALALCELGASFLADDVLALELRDSELLAHPGGPRAAIKGESERLVKVAGARAPVPLRAVVLIERGGEATGRPVLAPLRGGRELLAGSFNLMLRDPERSARLLEVCALVARTRALRLRADPALDAAELAEAMIGSLRAPR
jgi:hypothetical protein